MIATETTTTKTATTYDYRNVYEASAKVNWQVDDLIGPDKKLDFSRPFMPEALALSKLPFLSADEQRILNQIRGHNYLYLFGLVEEFIVPYVIGHVTTPQADDYQTRALLQFAGEEAKHIQLFKKFREEFLKAFGTDCEVIGPAEAIAQAVLSHGRLGVGLAILHIEWMTQRHYLESVKDDTGIDPRFASLLRHHWMEEAQHAKLDTCMVEEIAAASTSEEIAQGIADYAAIGALLDGGICQQVLFDADSLERAIGRKLAPADREELVSLQTKAMRYTFLGSGMTHPRFLDTLGRISSEGRKAVEEMAPTFC